MSTFWKTLFNPSTTATPTYPLDEFLAFLDEKKDDYSLRVTVRRAFGSDKIREIAFQFHQELEQIVPLKEVTGSDYQAWLNEPDRILEYFQNHSGLQATAKKFEKEKKSLENLQWMTDIVPTKEVFGYNLNKQVGTPLIEMKKKLMDDAIHKGAFFNARFVDVFNAYGKMVKERELKRLTPEADHIETELVTILNDPEVDEEVRMEAQETLTEYRERKGNGSQKTDNARLSIQTIRQHYLD